MLYKSDYDSRLYENNMNIWEKGRVHNFNTISTYIILCILTCDKYIVCWKIKDSYTFFLRKFAMYILFVHDIVLLRQNE